MEKTPLRQLADGELPQMVHWYHPQLLARIWVRTIISKVFGQFADHRQIQAATDQVDKSILVSRYDYSDPNAADPGKRLKTDGAGAVWVDYVADTGDGFESTYTMAYMLANEQLQVKGAGALPRGELLILGGDQAYPQATREEYENRLITPFGWAHTSPQNHRKAFAIPGNHDWYDGLAAFDSLFCTARDPLSGGTGTIVGGWQFKQHRSYWAIKLPHNWWIWGADIQFSKFLDNAQINYFEAAAEQMGPDDNLVICLSEPAWLLAEQQGTDEEENLFKLATIARASGARVSAVIAGDWHHYNRYYADDIDAHFFTAGGGGAFLHSTHVLRDDISVTWPESKNELRPEVVPPAPATKGNIAKGIGAKGEQWRTRKVGMNLRRRTAKRELPPPLPSARAPQPEAVGEVLEPAAGSTAPRVRTAPRSSKCYPPKGRCKMLSFKNLLFPIFNKWFALGIGIIYWIVTWTFHSFDKAEKASFDRISNVGITVDAGPRLEPVYVAYWEVWQQMPIYLGYGVFGSVIFSLMFFGLAAILIWYVHATEKRGFWRWFVKMTVGSAHFAAHLVAMLSILLLLNMINNRIAPSLEPLVKAGLQNQDSFIATILRPVSKYQVHVEQIAKQEKKPGDPGGQRKAATRAVTGADAPPSDTAIDEYNLDKFFAEIEGPTSNLIAVDSGRLRNLVGLLYPFQMAILGGLVGGFIWGAYWVLTGLLGRMHAEQAFAALRIKNYKNFLRMRFDADSLTIYPIGLDQVADKKGWMNLPDGNTDYVNKPRLIASPPLRPELIEEPIVIYSGRQTS